MTKIILPLTREFLESHDFRYEGVNYKHNKSEVELTESNESGTWMVTIPNLPTDIPQPTPLRDYTDLFRLLLSVMGGFIEDKQKGIEFINEQVKLKNISDLMAEYFDFDENIKLKLNITQNGIQIAPNNEYTFTLAGGNEFEFKLTYSLGNKVKELIFYSSPEVISTYYLNKLMKLNSIENYELGKLEVKINDAWELFYGSGIKFDEYE